MKFDLFADSVANVSIANGVVRVAGESPAEQREIHLSVNLRLPTFVSSMNVLQQVMGRVIEQGVVNAGAARRSGSAS
jgi:hypothetical protein